MIKNIFIAMLLFTLKSFGQQLVDVADNTLKVSAFGTEEFYYGFAEGDQIIFNFEEENGKELKEIEIIEMPSSSKFMDYKTKKIVNKTININQTSIYKFRFYNSALGGRICKFKIQRIPANDATKKFNTTVYTKTVVDTNHYTEQEKYIVRSDTTAAIIVEQTAKVSSTNALNGNTNKTIVDFMLPKGTISWGYFIGVGNEGKQEYKKGNEKFLSAAAKTVYKFSSYGPMAALALTGLNLFNQAQGGDNVKYCVTNRENAQLFMAGQQYKLYKQGNVINDASQMKLPLEGKMCIGLLNDNIMEPIDVTVKITAIVVNQQWGTRPVQKFNTSSREVMYLKP